MSELTEFLLARIAEDEAVAKAAGPDGRPLGGHWTSRRPGDPDLHVYGEYGWFVDGPDVETHDSNWGRSVADHIARHDPARVLAECEAKRRIVEWMSDEVEYVVYGDDVLRTLAAVYADHPDYDKAWHA